MTTSPTHDDNAALLDAADRAAAQLIPALASIIETGAWAEFHHPMRGLQQYDTFADYCADFVGIGPHSVIEIIERTTPTPDSNTVLGELAGHIRLPANDPDAAIELFHHAYTYLTVTGWTE